MKIFTKFLKKNFKKLQNYVKSTQKQVNAIKKSRHDMDEKFSKGIVTGRKSSGNIRNKKISMLN